MKWTCQDKPTPTYEELVDHINMVHSVLLMYMHQNKLTELVVPPPDEDDSALRATLKFSMLPLDQGEYGAIVVNVITEEKKCQKPMN